MQSSNIVLPRDESTKTLHDYLGNNYYKHFIALSLIFMFSIVFNLIYLIVDSFVDKSKHYELAVEAYERYEEHKRRKLAKESFNNETSSSSSSSSSSSFINSKNNNNNNNHKKLENYEIEKENLQERKRNIDFNVWSYKNLQISFIHSLACSIWLVRIIWLRNAEMMNDLLAYVSWDTYLLVAFSSGYFLYDFYDVYANGYARKEWVICIHHFIVLLTFSYHIMNLLNVAYTILALTMEFNSVFLHARKLLKFYMFKRDSFMFRLNSFLNILTFVVFRFGVLVTILLGIIYDGHRVSVEYLIMLGSCTFAMGIINLVLFKRLLDKDWLNNKRKLETSKNSNNSINSTYETLVTNDLKLSMNLKKCFDDNNESIITTNNNNNNNNNKSLSQVSCEYDTTNFVKSLEHSTITTKKEY